MQDIKRGIISAALGFGVLLSAAPLVYADDATPSAAATASSTTSALTGTVGDMGSTTQNNQTNTTTVNGDVGTTSTSTDQNTSTSTPSTSSSYYPNAFPSSWYLLPGQILSFSGTGFAPGEMITITGEGMNASSTVSGGSFNANNAFTIPYSWAGSNRTFMVGGDTSGSASTPRPITISVGKFYPQITPSSWWIGNGQSINVAGTGFAPGEEVRLMVEGNQTTQTADGSGTVNFNVTLPSSGGTVTLRAEGTLSGASSERTVYLHS